MKMYRRRQPWDFYPANIQTIVGSTNVKRVREICRASDIYLTREEWYEMYLSAGKKLP